MGSSTDTNALQHKGLVEGCQGRYAPVMPMRARRPDVNRREPASLHGRAEADLAFVRAAVERSAHFTAVPGKGGMLMGATALIAAVVATMQASDARWLTVWLTEAAVAGTIGLVTLIRKAKRRQLPLVVGPARRFGLGLVPALVAGAALTIACIQLGVWSLLPTVWMLCYGVAILGAGAASPAPIVPIVGSVFVACGAISIATPPAWGDAWMAITFGVTHVVAGAIIARHHGG